jgi:hypothetical protein
MNMSIRIERIIAPYIKIDLLPNFSTLKYKQEDVQNPRNQRHKAWLRANLAQNANKELPSNL